MAILPVEVQFIKINEEAVLPKQAHEGDAGFDLYPVEEVEIAPGDVKIVCTGLKISIPEGHEGQVRSRSGRAAKDNVVVLNAPGTIDSGYTGLLKVILINHGAACYYTRKHEAVAQLVVKPTLPRILIKEVKEFTKETTRGEAGFGSTDGK